MISRPFIDRPLQTCILSAFIVIAGLIALRMMPVSLYPDILPPMVEVVANYPGATPEVGAETVAAPLEQQINGAPGIIYLRSGAAPNGTVQIVASFAIGTDPNQAVIEVQNRVQAAQPLLPEEVRRQGVVVRRLSWTALSYITIDSPDGRYDDAFISNYTLINIVDELRRLPGVAAVDAYGAKEYSIRVWLQPDRLAQLGLTPVDVVEAIREQNSQYATGRIGDPPMLEPVDMSIAITAQGRLSSPEQFEQVIIKSDGDGATVRLKDVARVELGAKDYATSTTQRGRPALAIGIFPDHGTNLIELSDAVRATMERLERQFPPGLRWQVPFDTSDFVRVSIREVVKTLIEAVFLVVLIVFLFMQNWRATLIPCLAIPVSLIGALVGMQMLGVTLNMTTLFAMVLSIGIVVDDAIVVLENIERHMHEEGISAREATYRAMGEVTGPLIAIVLVLTAVFLPVAFLGGLVGEMYRQFAITISVSVMISGFVALTLTPALCALFLKPVQRGHKPSRAQAWFERLTLRYTGGARRLLRHTGITVMLFAAIIAAAWGMARQLPTSLVPEEDQGYVIALPFLPPAASQSRTETVMKTIEEHFANHPAVLETVSFSGSDPYSFLPRQNAGFSFITLRHWDERDSPELHSSGLVGEIMALGESIRDGLVFGAAPPPIEGLSATGGFEGFVQSRVGSDYKALEAAVAQLVAAAAERPELAGVFTTFTAQVPQLHMDLDRDRAKMLGLDIDDVFAVLQSTFGAYYVNDFNMLGRAYRVQIQADAPYRSHPEDLRHVYVRSTHGEPIPVTALGEVRRTTGPDLVERFNVFPAARLLGAPAPGYSSGQALAVMEALARDHLPEGYTLEWNAQAWLEKQSEQNTAGLYLLGMAVVFLILMAQYERLTLPFAVILSLPFAVFGALAAVWARGLYNDLYFQIGLVTLIGLAAKNAILIVEFAARLTREGMDSREAAMEAVRLRFRPIVMTSLAFILGVVPLAISSGAGANARHSIGTGVIGGMLAATFIATLFTPVFYCWTERWAASARRLWGRARRRGVAAEADDPAR